MLGFINQPIWKEFQTKNDSSGSHVNNRKCCHLPRTEHVPGIMLNTLHELSNLILTITIGGRGYCRRRKQSLWEVNNLPKLIQLDKKLWFKVLFLKPLSFNYHPILFSRWPKSSVIYSCYTWRPIQGCIYLTVKAIVKPTWTRKENALPLGNHIILKVLWINVSNKAGVNWYW